MVRACGTHGRQQKYRVLMGKPEGKSNLKDLDKDERIILK
jgi:hypothetical protein